MSTFPDIPEELQWFDSLKYRYQGVGYHRYGSEDDWSIVADEQTGVVEMRKIEKNPVSWKTMLLRFGACLIPFIVVVAIMFPWMDVLLRVLVCTLAPMIFAFLAGFLFLMAKSQQELDDLIWKGPIRFRFDPNTGEMEFPLDEKSYRKDEYRKAVLYVIRGLDMSTSVKRLGMIFYKDNRRRELPRAMQYVLLVLDRENRWHRHLLANDWFWEERHWKYPTGTDRFLRCAELLKPLVGDDAFIRSYSKEESFKQHHSLKPEMADRFGKNLQWE